MAKVKSVFAITKDAAKAAEWMKKAAKQGEAQGKHGKQ